MAKHTGAKVCQNDESCLTNFFIEMLDLWETGYFETMRMLRTLLITNETTFLDLARFRVEVDKQVNF